MRNSITFNAKNSYADFKLCIEERIISSPAKKKIKDSVPFMNGNYDFSTVGSNGEIVYDTREVKIKFGLPTRSKSELYTLYSEILEWLVDAGQQQLIFSDMPDYYFLGEVESATSIEEVLRMGRLEVSFTCEPFKIGTSEAGNQLWDTFNFLIDCMQDTSFTIAGSKTVTIYNAGRAVVPVVNCSSAMSCNHNGYTANFATGDNTDYNFKLLSGANTIAVIGTGTISFNFRKQIL
jgi:predicted phage tail component-like protein